MVSQCEFTAQKNTRKYNNRKVVVLIAKEVLKLLKYKKITPELGVYSRFTLDSSLLGEDLQTCIINNKVKDCKVCGIGAMFMAMIKLKDNYKVDGINFHNPIVIDSDNIYFKKDTNILKHTSGGGNLTKALGKYLTGEQLILVEDIFEGLRDFLYWSTNYSLENRIKIIMRNFIKNNGVLVKDEILKYNKKLKNNYYYLN